MGFFQNDNMGFATLFQTWARPAPPNVFLIWIYLEELGVLGGRQPPQLELAIASERASDSELASESEGRLKAEAEGGLKTEAEGRLKTEAEGRLKNEAEGQLKTDAEVPCKTETEGRLKTET